VTHQSPGHNSFCCFLAAELWDSRVFKAALK